MSIKKDVKKLQKRKKEKKKRVLGARAVIREKAREEKSDFRRKKQIKKIQKDMVNIEHWASEFLQMLPDNTLDQLERNAKILKTLEQEYENDVTAKKTLNDKLEDAGYLTIDEKIGALQAETLKKQAEANMDDVGVGGTSDCCFSPVITEEGSVKTDSVK